LDRGNGSRLSAEPLVGLKQGTDPDEWNHKEAFSRTPRGFEAWTCRRRSHSGAPFSRTPRGFEATLRVNTVVPTPLSAEPLVGLKRHPHLLVGFRLVLSAEPLVGLKRLKPPRSLKWIPSFSRTPRGFEARTSECVWTTKKTFSRTPRGFEASASSARWRNSRTFSRTPRGFEARV